MSELKADNTFVFGEECLAYKKEDADKVIAELKSDVVKLKSSLKYLVVRGIIDGPVKKAAEDVLKEVEHGY